MVREILLSPTTLAAQLPNRLSECVKLRGFWRGSSRTSQRAPFPPPGWPLTLSVGSPQRYVLKRIIIVARQMPQRSCRALSTSKEATMSNRDRPTAVQTPTARRAELIVLLALLISATLAVLAASAHAASSIITVVNDRGVPQSGVTVRLPSGYPFSTDSNGQATVELINSGDVLHVSRDAGNGSPCGAAPEGYPGVAVAVPNPVPSSLTVTVPSDGLTPVDAQLSDYERGLVGLINQQRATQGIAPLYISLALNDAAAGYVGVAPEYAAGITNDQAHCSVFGPAVRMLDVGLPTENGLHVGENLAWSSSARSAFQSWMGSALHREAMLSPAFNAVGVANSGDKWLIDLAYVNPVLAGVSRARMTSDTGDPSLANGPLPVTETDTEVDTDLLDPALRISRSLSGHWIKARIHSAPGVGQEGTITLTVKHGRVTRAVSLSSALTARIRVGAGRWRLIAKFKPKRQAAYALSTVTVPVTVGKTPHRHS